MAIQNDSFEFSAPAESFWSQTPVAVLALIAVAAIVAVNWAAHTPQSAPSAAPVQEAAASAQSAVPCQLADAGCTRAPSH
jgi:hypothetical protein